MIIMQSIAKIYKFLILLKFEKVLSLRWMKGIEFWKVLKIVSNRWGDRNKFKKVWIKINKYYKVN